MRSVKLRVALRNPVGKIKEVQVTIQRDEAGTLIVRPLRGRKGSEAVTTLSDVCESLLWRLAKAKAGM